MIRFAKSRIRTLAARLQLQGVLLKSCNESDAPLNPESWHKSLENPTEYYLNCVRFFYQNAPEFLKFHRAYFRQNQRGFGEDAFHVMWYGLCQVLS